MQKPEKVDFEEPDNLDDFHEVEDIEQQRIFPDEVFDDPYGNEF